MKKTYIVAILGYWGRGETLKEAAEKCREQGAGRKDMAVAWLVLGDDKAYIDGNGSICYEQWAKFENAVELDDKVRTDCIVIGKFFRIGALCDLTK